MKYEVLDGLFSPKSIAVIGASNTKGKIGYTVVDNLIQSNYPGPVYPITPKEDEIQGSKSYSSVLD
ncbi:MAG: CoA-binding protein, partial [Anaerolineae bacterium]|nr:CoA-binding protein [Anaerolineae bacterium]